MPGLDPVGWPELLACLACGAGLVVVVVVLYAVLRWVLEQSWASHRELPRTDARRRR